MENKHGVKISTVEHLLAALYIAGIDNVIIEIDNEEVPIMDGSAKFFLNLLEKSEINLSNKKIKYIKILNKVELIDGSRKISIEPNENFEVDFQLNYQNTVIDQQRNVINFDKDDLNEVIRVKNILFIRRYRKNKKTWFS